MADTSRSRASVGTERKLLAPDGVRPVGGSAALTFQVLGPLRVWRDGVEIDTGLRQQNHLLAVLLIHAHRPVSTAELIEFGGGDSRPTAGLNMVQKYVGTLRRLLDPDLSAGEPGSYLHRRSGGYQFDAGQVELDLAEFRQFVGLARVAVEAQRLEEGVDAYEE